MQTNCKNSNESQRLYPVIKIYFASTSQYIYLDVRVRAYTLYVFSILIVCQYVQTFNLEIQDLPSKSKQVKNRYF